MPHDIEALGKPIENQRVAVAVNHLRSIPERIVITLGGIFAIVNGRIQAHPFSVDRFSTEHLVVKIVGRSCVIERFVYRLVLTLRVIFGTDEFSRQTRLLLSIVNCPAFRPGWIGECDRAEVGERVAASA